MSKIWNDADLTSMKYGEESKKLHSTSVTQLRFKENICRIKIVEWWLWASQNPLQSRSKIRFSLVGGLSVCHVAKAEALGSVLTKDMGGNWKKHSPAHMEGARRQTNSQLSFTLSGYKQFLFVERLTIHEKHNLISRTENLTSLFFFFFDFSSWSRHQRFKTS